MTRAEIIRHNAKIILGQVRGKSEPERRLHYARLQAGPLAPLYAIIEAMIDRKAEEIMRGLARDAVNEVLKAQNTVTVDDFTRAHEDILRTIERGARAATAKRFDLRG